LFFEEIFVPNYRFFLKPIGDAANEAIADQLNKIGDAAHSCEDQTIMVDGEKVYGVYLVPEHTLLTMVGHSQHKRNVQAYVQEGEGEIRTYAHFKKIGRNPEKALAVQAVKAALAKKK
jgi:hypothetical protein